VAVQVDEETNRRMTFKTLAEVLDETVRLLERSAQELTDQSARSPQRERLMMTTLAHARTRAAESLRSFRGESKTTLDRTWLQYAGSLEKAGVLNQELARERSSGRAILLVTQLDECLVAALDGLSRSYSPPLESCEKASALINHLRRASSAIVNSARDI
jgi:hypothetical protein